MPKDTWPVNHVSGPVESGAAVTPNDSTELDPIPRALWVGTLGHISMVLANGVAVTLLNVPVGMLPVRARRVRATGTTATDIVALW